MSPALSAVLQSWDWRLEVIAGLLLMGTLYLRGWQSLRRREAHAHLSKGWRLAAYLGGLALVALALMSPIDVLGGQLFYMHMIQHLLLVMVAPPLLLIANPFPVIVWGLPQPARQKVAGLFAKPSAFRRVLRTVTPPGVAWMLFIALFLGWHDARAYNAALRFDWVHDLEHATFFGSAMLFWWHVTGAGPKIHGRFSVGMRAAYLLITVPVNMLTGVTIAFSSEPIYTFYTTVPRLWNIGVMEDQMLGGVLMWIPGSMMYIVAALILLANKFRAEDRKHVTSYELRMASSE